MITNTGKNIIAKYLIGEAPAYASFMALGCGAEPRNTINSLSDVDTFEYDGVVVLPPSPNPTNIPITINIINSVSTNGLLPGMTIAGVGVGSFGGGSATIISVTPTSITVTAGTGSETKTVGAIKFYVFGSYSLVKIENTSSLWKGARLSQVSSQGGSLDQSSITIVDELFNAVTGTGARPALARITPGPVFGKIQDGVFSIQIDPRIKSLELESVRVPITSRGYVNDSGTNKIILTAQLPSEERYEFTEIGIYSAGSNRTAGVFDSKTISPFSATEGWQLNANGTISNPSTTNSSFREYDTSIIDSNNNMTAEEPAIKIRTSNGIFANQNRIERYEKTRYLDNVFLTKGDNSFIYKQSTDQVILDTSPSKQPKFLQLSNTTVDLSKNSSSDLIKLAFSIVSVNGNNFTELPLDTFIIVEFLNGALTESAKMEIQINRNEYDLVRNRYIVATKKLEDLIYTSQFSWKNANTIRIYTSTTRDVFVTKKISNGTTATITTSAAHELNIGDRIFVSGVAGGAQDLNGIKTITAVTTTEPHTISYASTAVIPSEASVDGSLKATDNKFYVALDALRLDNINTVNPIYGLVGYSIIQNETKRPVIKSPNTQNFVEYRFVLDVT
jgi:hypothetical protein